MFHIRNTKHDWYFESVSRENHPELLAQNEGLKRMAGTSKAAVYKAEDEAIEAKRKHEDLVRKQKRQVTTKSKTKVKTNGN